MKKIQLKTMGLLLLSTLVLVACSKSEPADVATDTDVVAVTTSEEVSNLPAGCEKSSVVYTSDDGDINYTADQSHYLTNSAAPERGLLLFANYDDLDLVDPFLQTLSSGQMLISVDLKGGNKAPITTTIYNGGVKDDAEGLKDKIVGIETVMADGLSGGISGDADAVGLTYVGDDYVCGEIMSGNDKAGFNGMFVAKVSKE